MASTTALLTSDEFLALPEERTFLCELIGGEIVEMGDTRARHEILKSNIAETLFVYAWHNRDYRVLQESMFIVSPADAMVPDVSIGWRETLDNTDPEKRFPGAPLIAAEVVSSESAARLAHKIKAYLGAGAKEVWVVYWEERSLVVHRQDGTARWLRESDSLTTETLPGYQVLVSRFFEGV